MSSKGPQVSCVTGTINRLNLLQRLVESVRASVGDLSYEIVVVDNDSSDGTAEWLRAQEDVVYCNVGTPKGSVAAFQLGFETCKGEFVVTLNDDIAVEGNSIYRAYHFMKSHPEVGQVAFGHRYQNRDRVDPGKPIVQSAIGYTYAQCGMTRRWLGDLIGWCGDYVHYAWDTRISLRIWELGYKVVPLDGCSVLDWEFEDEIRDKFSQGMRNKQGHHPDTVKFFSRWKGRLPDPSKWVPAHTPHQSLVEKIVSGNCRVLRFKAMMAPGDPMRTALIKAFETWGPAHQVNQDAIINNVGLATFQQRAVDIVSKYQPDFVMMQAQRPNNLLPGTIAYMVKTFPDTFFFNWDADTHYPLETFHYQVAIASTLQGLISPSYFETYYQNGASNVCYWPIGVEQEFIDGGAKRDPSKVNGPDVIFLGSLYGEGKFPEAETRARAVLALHKHPKIKLRVHGYGWNKVGIKTTQTSEEFGRNPLLYNQSRMALSISQTKELWGYSSDRLYNICANGCPALIQRFEGMDEHGFVDGVSCIAWRTLPEMLDKVTYYIEHPAERERIGYNGRQVVLARHTWPRRLQGLLCMLEGMDYVKLQTSWTD